MPLYGQELTRTTTPFDAGLGRVIAFGTEANPRGDFVGRAALEAAKAAEPRQVLVGLVGDGRRSPRAGYAVTDAGGTVIGEVTSGAPSPTLGRPVGMAYVVPSASAPGTAVLVDVRGRGEPMTVAALPLYRRA
jgi:aminomethyltransferase